MLDSSGISKVKTYIMFFIKRAGIG